MSRRRPRTVRLGLLVILAVVVVGVALVGWRVWHARSELQQSRASALQLQTALDQRDVPAARQALTELRAHSRAASDQTSGPTWGLLTHAPVYGDDAAAVRTLSRVLDDLSHRGLEPLVSVADALHDQQLAPRNGRVPLAPIQRLQRPLDGSQASFDSADRTLAGLSPGSYVGPIASATRQLTDLVARGRTSVDHAARLAAVLPEMLGADGPRRYLLVLQNNAEIRSTGGLPGSVFVLQTDGGRVQLGGFVAGGSLFASPPVELSPAETALFDPRVGARFIDADTIPDFPRVAQIWRTQWRQHDGQKVDGVISADPVLLSYLMQASGPIKVDGQTLTSANVVQQLLNTTYARFPTEAGQDAFFKKVGLQVFSSVISAPHVDALIQAIRRGADEGRLLVNLSRPAQQRLVAGLGVAGGLPDAAGGQPHVGVYVNDRTPDIGSKLSYYLTTVTLARSTDCTGGRESFTGSTTFSSSAPKGGVGIPPYVSGTSPVPGQEGLVVYLVAPRGGGLSEVAVDGKPVDLAPVDLAGRPAASVPVTLPAGTSVEVTWRVTGAAGETGPLTIDSTPGLRTPSRSVSSSSCH